MPQREKLTIDAENGSYNRRNTCKYETLNTDTDDPE
jgi:hypothetical protein